MLQPVGRPPRADTSARPCLFAAPLMMKFSPVTRLPAAFAESDTDRAPEVGWLWDSSVSRTKAQLKSINARPKKALGQNFVTDQCVLSSVVEKSCIRAGDLVLEIGPGTGNLTRSLLKVLASALKR